MDMAISSAAKELAAIVATEPTQRYSGFPWWHALLVDPNREQKAADWLHSNIKITVYWPHYTKQIGRSRTGQKRRPRQAAAIPGMLFAPCEVLAIRRREEVFDLAHIHGLMTTGGAPTMLTKADIEKIRVMEAKLNLPPEAKGVFFKRGDKVRFTDDLYTDWGNGVIFEIASEARIGVEVDKLFGRRTKVYVPASEIEAM